LTLQILHPIIGYGAGGAFRFSNRPSHCQRRWQTKGIVAMTKQEDVLAFEVSDEALEAAAGSEQVNYTLGACTGLSVCPG
jgi:hypothetical protein